MQTTPLQPNVRVGVAAIIVKSVAGKTCVLMSQRKVTHGQGTWQLPGGHLEMGESWQQCAQRETLEETNLNIDMFEFFTCTNDVYSTQKHYVTIFMRAQLAESDTQEPKQMEPEKSSEWHWIEWGNWPQPLFLSMQNMVNALK